LDKAKKEEYNAYVRLANQKSKEDEINPNTYLNEIFENESVKLENYDEYVKNTPLK
jgi:hypothetical protein